MEIINERPAGMSFEDYKAIRKQSNDELKNVKRGEMIFVAIEKGYKKGRTAKRKNHIPKPVQEKINA